MRKIILFTFLLLACNEKEQTEPTNSFTDARDGKTYKTVKIGEQVWMGENLNYESEDSEDSRCYDYDLTNCDKYGRLYNLRAALTACPKGWHLPSDEEWQILKDFCIFDNVIDYDAAGKKLKATSGWAGDGTDEYGFSALPSGFGNANGSFVGIGFVSFWWSASFKLGNYSYDVKPMRWELMYDRHSMLNYSGNNADFYSVRCLKD